MVLCAGVAPRILHYLTQKARESKGATPPGVPQVPWPRKLHDPEGPRSVGPPLVRRRGRGRGGVAHAQRPRSRAGLGCHESGGCGRGDGERLPGLLLPCHCRSSLECKAAWGGGGGAPCVPSEEAAAAEEVHEGRGRGRGRDRSPPAPGVRVLRRRLAASPGRGTAATQPTSPPGLRQRQSGPFPLSSPNAQNAPQDWICRRQLIWTRRRLQCPGTHDPRTDRQWVAVT